MIGLNINSMERKRMMHYAEHSLFEKAHWGDGEVLIPEEKMLYDQLKEETEKLELTFTQFKILINWFFESTNDGKFLMEEDSSILTVLVIALQIYNKENNIFSSIVVEDITTAIDLLKTLFIIKWPKDQYVNNYNSVNEKIEKITENKEELDQYKTVLLKKFQKKNNIINDELNKIDDNEDNDNSQKDDSELSMHNIDTIAAKVDNEPVKEQENQNNNNNVVNDKIKQVSEKYEELNQYKKELFKKFKENNLLHSDLNEIESQADKDNNQNSDLQLKNNKDLTDKINDVNKMNEEIKRADLFVKDVQKKYKGKKIF